MTEIPLKLGRLGAKLCFLTITLRFSPGPCGYTGWKHRNVPATYLKLYFAQELVVSSASETRASGLAPANNLASSQT